MQIYGNLDVEGSGQVQNLRIENLETDPTTPITGQIWFNTVSGLYKSFDGLRVNILNPPNLVDFTYGMDSSLSYTSTSTAPNQVLDLVDVTTFRTLKYLVSVTANSKYQATELLIVHDGITPSILDTCVCTDDTISTFDALIHDTTLVVCVTPKYDDSVYNVIRLAVNT